MTSQAASPKRLPHAESARTLQVLTQRGVLSTVDEPQGYPYGSLVEYISTDEGDAVFLLSELAEHTANFKADGRASLFVSPALAPAGPRQARALALERVTLMGDIEPVDARDAYREAYLERHPHASTYIDFSDFSFWRLRVQRVRYIGGFGRMSWVDTDAYRKARPDPIAADAAGAIDHMNDDHQAALIDYARAFGGVDAVDEVTMVAIDRLGFDLEVRDDVGGASQVRVGFDAPLEKPAQVRRAMVEMVQKARKQLE